MVKVGGDSATSSRQTGSAEMGAAPAARRLGSSRWRDPRLAVGIVLVAASVVVGARVVAAADDTVAVWSLRQDVTVGSELTADDVTVSDVRFDESEDSDRYFGGDQPLPDDLVAAHDLVAGELLTRSALVEPASEATNELPLPVADGLYPTDLEPGDRVDVWIASDDAADPRADAEQVLEGVAILQIDVASSSVGGGASTVVLVALEPDDAASLDQLLASVMTGSVFLVRVGE